MVQHNGVWNTTGMSSTGSFPINLVLRVRVERRVSLVTARRPVASLAATRGRMARRVAAAARGDGVVPAARRVAASVENPVVSFVSRRRRAPERRVA